MFAKNNWKINDPTLHNNFFWLLGVQINFSLYIIDKCLVNIGVCVKAKSHNTPGACEDR